MEPFIVHRGRIALFEWTDVNTDLIIPARYLKRIERTGYGPLLFADKRYAAGSAPAIDDPGSHGPEAPDFPLNRPEARGSTILLVGRNFGCGSSREHAVWAIAQAGYRVLLAPGKDEGFADIFESNAFNNGLLPIELPAAEWNTLAEATRRTGGAEATIDLRAQTITVHGVPGSSPACSFEVPEARRHRLLNGLDAIAETLLHETAIRSHEQHAPAWNAPAQA
jgi:3-isopropylmalate/(R)-2-methylmalate dehydratase small subunit